MNSEQDYWEFRTEIKMKIAPWAFLLMLIAWSIGLAGAIIFGVDETTFELLVMLVVIFGIMTLLSFLCCSQPNISRNSKNESHIEILSNDSGNEREFDETIS